VVGYKIFKDGIQVGTSSTNSYSDAGLSAATTHTYTVAAYDASGNVSAQSTGASATTASNGGNGGGGGSSGGGGGGGGGGCFISSAAAPLPAPESVAHILKLLATLVSLWAQDAVF